MKVNRQKLLSALKTVSRVVAKKSSLPVLSNIYLEEQSGILVVQASNLERSLKTTIDCEPGALCTTVAAQLIIDLVLQADGEMVEMELVKTKLTVNCGSTKSSLTTIEADEFLPFGDIPSDWKKISGSTIEAIKNHVAFAASTDGFRPVMQGVYIANGKAVSTDGFRIAAMDVLGFDKPAIVPSLAIADMQAVFSRSSDVFWTLSGGHIWVRNDSTVFRSSLVDGNYPDFNAIIPKKHKTLVTVKTLDFIRACKTVNVIAREGTSLIILSIEGDKIQMSSQSDEVGNTNVEIETKNEGSDLRIAFNVNYLLEAVQAAKSAYITIKANEKTTPAMIEDSSFPGWFVVIMPMHTDNK